MLQKWEVRFVPSALDDLEWFGRATARTLFREIVSRLQSDPVSETRNLKTLRVNAAAQRELRLAGRYRALFSIEVRSKEVTVVMVGEKVGSALVVRGKRYTAHEDHPAE